MDEADLFRPGVLTESVRLASGITGWLAVPGRELERAGRDIGLRTGHGDIGHHPHGAGRRAGHQAGQCDRAIDADDGQLTIESQGTKYDVTLTPTAVRDIQEGDQVALTIQKSTRGSTQHGDAPAKR